MDTCRPLFRPAMQPADIASIPTFPWRDVEPRVIDAQAPPPLRIIRVTGVLLCTRQIEDRLRLEFPIGTARPFGGRDVTPEMRLFIISVMSRRIGFNSAYRQRDLPARAGGSSMAELFSIDIG